MQSKHTLQGRRLVECQLTLQVQWQDQTGFFGKCSANQDIVIIISSEICDISMNQL